MINTSQLLTIVVGVVLGGIAFNNLAVLAQRVPAANKLLTGQLLAP